MIFYGCWQSKRQRYNFEDEKTDAKRSDTLTVMYFELDNGNVLYILKKHLVTPKPILQRCS